MRLLRARDLTFHEFVGTTPPPYATLSHRWIGKEAKLSDIENGRNTPQIETTKAYQLAQYVQKHLPQLEYIWVDSCCINQDSSMELSEAVNCMFDWYQNASVCLTYLHDIKQPSDDIGKSVWFTRGWTLQELLASRIVIFLTKDWQVIGHKGRAELLSAETGPNLDALISSRTGIPLSALSDPGNIPSHTTEQKRQWMNVRETQREEDTIYALFGILGVTLGANYGEKRKGAERRLLDALQQRENTSKSVLQEQKFQDIVSWLSPSDPWKNHGSARQLHECETGTWLINSDEYSRFKTGVNQHLWLHGKPGCGKTILFSCVVEDLIQCCEDRSNVGLGVFYFSFSDDHKQSYEDLLRSLIRQLAWREPALSLLCQSHTRLSGKTPNTTELEQILLASFQSLDRVFVALDAPDECGENNGSRRYLLKRLEALAPQTSKLQLFVTSRHLADIRSSMEAILAEEISLETGHTKADIDIFISAQLSSDPRLREFTPVIKTTIKSNISHNADGMFRWASLLLTELSNLKSSKIKAIEKVLERFPTSLDEVYAQILSTIDEDSQEDALCLLQWMAYSREPLTLAELTDALVIDVEESTADLSNRGAHNDIFRLLSSLIIIVYDKQDAGVSAADRKDNIGPATKAQLAHFTVKEYLESQRILQSSANHFHLERSLGHHFLTNCCLTYLLCYSAHSRKSQAEEDLTTFPLLSYSAKTWYHHSSLHSGDATQELRFLTSMPSITDWLRVHDPDHEDYRPFDEESYSHRSEGLGIYFAIYLNLPSVFHSLLERGSDVNARCGYFGNPLAAASVTGRLEIIESLVANNADVNARGGPYCTALQCAALRGDVQTVKLLLAHNADVNIRGGHSVTALHAAAAYSHREVFEILLEAGADPHYVGDSYGSTLEAAAPTGDLEMIQALLSRNVDVNAPGGPFGSAMQAAAIYGHVEVAKLLIQEGANVDVMGGLYGDVLQAASAAGSIEMVQLLLDKGMNAARSAPHGLYGSSLQAASACGHIEMVKLLLSRGADLNKGGGGCGPAVQIAAQQGHHALVEHLIAVGAELNVCNDDLGYPLQAAALEGYNSIVEILLAAGAKIDARGGRWGTALQAAVAANRVQTIELLLASGADVNQDGGRYDNALQTASHQGNMEAVKLLLAAGADVHATGGEYGHALQDAASEGHLDVARTLLAAGAEVNAQGGRYGNPLQAAASQGHLEIVRVLLDEGALVNKSGGHHGRALIGAVHHGRIQVIQLLIEKGADVNAQGGLFGTPLQAASVEGHLDVVRLLLGAGANVNADGGRYGRALIAASDRGHVSIVQLLLDNGAEVNAKGRENHVHALQACSKEGHIDVVKLLLQQRDIQINADSGVSGPAMQAAAEYGHVAVVKLLIESGADVNVTGGRYGYPLQAAAACNRLEVAKVLLQHGADVRASGGEYGSALIAAQDEGDGDMIELLQAAISEAELKGQAGKMSLQEIINTPSNS